MSPLTSSNLQFDAGFLDSQGSLFYYKDHLRYVWELQAALRMKHMGIQVPRVLEVLAEMRAAHPEYDEGPRIERRVISPMTSSIPPDENWSGWMGIRR